MKAIGVAPLDIGSWKLDEGDEVVRVIGGPTPYALNIQVSAKSLGYGRHVALACQLKHMGYKNAMRRAGIQSRPQGRCSAGNIDERQGGR